MHFLFLLILIFSWMAAVIFSFFFQPLFHHFFSLPSVCAESFWDSSAFETDTDLPSGWMRVRDTSGTYYWHIPTGTTQWEPPSPLGKVGDSMMSSTMSLETTPCEEQEVRSYRPYYRDKGTGLWNSRSSTILFYFPGFLGSSLQHRRRSWWRGTVEGQFGKRVLFSFGRSHKHLYLQPR